MKLIFKDNAGNKLYCSKKGTVATLSGKNRSGKLVDTPSLKTLVNRAKSQGLRMGKLRIHWGKK